MTLCQGFLAMVAVDASSDGESHTDSPLAAQSSNRAGHARFSAMVQAGSQHSRMRLAPLTERAILEWFDPGLRPLGQFVRPSGETELPDSLRIVQIDIPNCAFGLTSTKVLGCASLLRDELVNPQCEHENPHRRNSGHDYPVSFDWLLLSQF